MTLTLFFIFLLALALNLGYLKLANRLSIVDVPKSRGAHEHKVVSSAGIVFSLFFIFYLLIRYIDNPEFLDMRFFWTLVCSAVLFTSIGFLDDWYEMTPKIRLIFQILSSVITALILTPHDWYIYETWPINYPITLGIVSLYILSFMNFFNFMDGINGLAGSQAILLLLPLSLIGYGFSDIYLVLGVLILAFLVFNFPKAKMFMGDSGSYFLGNFIAITICYHTFLSDTNIFFALNILLIIFWVDPVVTLLFRLAAGENILLPHNQHFYQKLTRLLGSHTKTVGVFLALYVFVLAPISYLCYVAAPAISAAIFLLLCLFFIFVFIFLKLKYSQI